MKLPISNFEVLRIIKEKVKHLHEFCPQGSVPSPNVQQICSDALYLFLVFQSNPLIVQLIYFMSISFAGFLALKNIKPQHKPTPRNLDLMFTSVSTLTVSSMATVETEDFSDQQLWVFIILMLLGEVFTSMLGLHFKNTGANIEDILLKRLPFTSRDIESSEALMFSTVIGIIWKAASQKQPCHIISSVVITIYLWIDSDARQLLKSTDIKIFTFSIFTAVSSFANCGFTPVNNNMAVFGNNSGLLLLVTPQILAGNTLFTPLLRLSIWALGKVSRREEYAYMLQHPKETDYRHLQPQKNSVYLVLTSDCCGDNFAAINASLLF